MSKKLLSEAQVRRFQSLACIQPIHEMESHAPVSEEVEEEVEMVDGEEEAVELDAADAVDMDTEEAPEEADVELDQDLVSKFAEAAATIGEVADILNAGSEEEFAGEEDLAPVEAEEEMEVAPEEEATEIEAAPEDEAELELQEALKGISYVPSQKEVVKEVAKRVAARLQEAKAAQAKLNRALGKK